MRVLSRVFLAALHFLLLFCTVTATRWLEWWTYEGISGPQFWGIVNYKDWALCEHGRQQSPINIEPSRLLYDPNLKHVQLDSTLMKGMVTNTGNDITVELQDEGYSSVNVSLGPLSYRYRAAMIKFHFANVDRLGSEHRIAGRSFPAEMHVLAYNIDLYPNITVALKGVKGIVIIAVFLEVGKETNKPFYAISKELKRLQDRGNRAMVHHIDIEQLLPKTDHYITYDGSLTQPGCYETVTWIIYNKPALISRDQMTALRVLYSARVNKVDKGGESSAEVAVSPRVTSETNVALNARPVMPLNHRVVRTNINTRKRSRLCTMERDMYYQVNEIYLKT